MELSEKNKGMELIEKSQKTSLALIDGFIYSLYFIFFIKIRRRFTAATFIYYSSNLVFTRLLEAIVVINLDL